MYRLALITPWPPQSSGIADYAHDLALGLAQPPKRLAHELPFDRRKGSFKVKKDNRTGFALQAHPHSLVIHGEDVAQHGPTTKETFLPL